MIDKPMPLMRIPAIFILTVLLLIVSVQAHGEEEGTPPRPWEYRLGEGLRVGETDFRLGGYINLNYEDSTSERGKFVFDDLSIFVFGNMSDKWRFFSEIEDTEFLEFSKGELGGRHRKIVHFTY